MKKATGGGVTTMPTKAKRLLTALLAVICALALMLPTMALNAKPAYAEGGTGTITITPPENTQANTSTTYKIYKVFDAQPGSKGTSVTYTTADGTVPDVSKHMPQGETYNAASTPHFIADSQNQVYYGTESDEAPTTGQLGTDYIRITKSDNTSVYVTYVKDGELTQAAIDAIAEYVKADDPTVTPTRTESTNGRSPVEIADVPYGYYYVNTTTGSVVSVGTVNDHPTITDKNSVPSVDKQITSVTASDASNAGNKDTAEGSVTTDGKDAIAQVGSKVWYTATVTFGKGSKNVVFHDQMSEGLKYNGDAQVVIAKSAANGTPTELAGNYYTVKETPDSGDTVTISFTDGLDAQGTTEQPNVTATITYSATVTGDALTVDSANNTAKVTYGDNNSSTQESRTDVYNAKIQVTKTDGSNAPLAGAGFKLSRQGASGIEYYYYNAAANTVTWTSDEGQATELITLQPGETGSNVNSNVLTFPGLPDGTYTLHESKVPSGYNQAPDQTITVAAVNNMTKAQAEDAENATSNAPLHKVTNPEANTSNIVNLNQGATFVNNMGTALPHTGGMGTTILYVIGAILVVGAAVTLIVRKRMHSQK